MIQLHQSSTPDAAVRELYESAFPLSEQRPWPQQLALVEEGRLKLLRLTRNNEFTGFIFCWQLPQFAFVEHFAITPEARGGGTGTTIMKLMEQHLHTIILEVEPADTEQAIRRIRFYERLGYKTFPDQYEQPPLRPGAAWLPLRLMYLNLPPELDFTTVKQELYREVYRVA